MPWSYTHVVLWLVIASSAHVAGCTSLLPPGKHQTATEYHQNCVSSIARHAPKLSRSRTADSQVAVSPAGKVRFSRDALRVASMLRVVSLLNRISELDSKGKRITLELLMIRQELTTRILWALLEVESSMAEVVCERDRADQVADRIDEVDGRTVKQLTVLSIIASGITGIITGGVSLASGATLGADVANVGGGFLATLFGVSALFTSSEVPFRHERNILKELWEDSGQPLIFSPTVWRYLHRPEDKNVPDPRALIVNEWRQKGRLGDPETDEEHRRQALFFGPGGRYSASDLRARASMLETLEASLRLVHEELEILIGEIITDHERAAIHLQPGYTTQGGFYVADDPSEREWKHLCSARHTVSEGDGQRSGIRRGDCGHSDVGCHGSGVQL
jgi:hypothetical protein